MALVDAARHLTQPVVIVVDNASQITSGEVRRGLQELKAGVESRRLSDNRKRVILGTIDEIIRRLTIPEFRSMLDKRMRELAP